MSDSADLIISVSIADANPEELDGFTRQLRSEIEQLDVDSVEDVSLGEAPSGAKALDWASIGSMTVTLAPTLIPPLFDLLKSWVERKPSTPVKIKIKVGKRTAQIEYDPTKTSAKELETLVRNLGKTITK